MEIVTGSTGAVHVTPIDDAVRNGNVGYLNDKVVFEYLNNFEAVDRTANLVRINSGYGMNQGRYFKIDDNDYDEVIIENGTSGLKRADLIVARYTMDSQTGFEDISLVVIRGQSGSEYVDPEYNTGDINSGATIDDFPLYRVKINGLELDGHPEPLFKLLPDGGRLGELEKKINTNMLIDLESSDSGNLNDCMDEENLDIGVKGNLSISHGGTGANTAAGAAKNIVIDAATADSNNISDSTEFITSAHDAGFINTIYKRTAIKLWNYILAKIKLLLGMESSEIVSVSHGGTGKSTITSGNVLVGNGTSTPTEKAVVENLDSPTHNKIPTAKAVADAMGSAGYGDMLKATYDPNNDGIIGLAQGGTGASSAAGARTNLGLGSVATENIVPLSKGGTGANSADDARANLGLGSAATENIVPIAKGGTGTNDGTLNGVKLALNGTTRGYYDANGNFKSFRQPTGNAAAGDVLSGKTFANSSNDEVTGTMPNRGSATRSINAGSSSTLDAGYYSGGTITANRYHNDNTYSYPQNSTGGTVDLGQGHDYRRVNAGNVYNKGYADGRAQGRSDQNPQRFQMLMSGDVIHVYINNSLLVSFNYVEQSSYAKTLYSSYAGIAWN